MIINNVEFYKSAVDKRGFPSDLPPLPEIAFAGKSNVGKSSLINSMLNRKMLAKTSKQPGKTRMINFYLVENRLYFADLPGYGYAKVSKSEKEGWGKMIEGYLKERESLKVVVLLIDIRHPPSENDKAMLNWLNYYGQQTIIAATKSDKIKRSQIAKHISIIKKALEFDGEIIPFSSQTKAGRDILWERIEEVI